MNKLIAQGYASGTTSARGGVSLVGEEGPELKVLPQGTGIIPNKITEELWAFGSNPAEYLSNIWRNIQAFNPLSGYGTPAFSSNITTNNQTVNIENIELNNVTNGNNFLSELNSFLRRTTKVTENK